MDSDDYQILDLLQEPRAHLPLRPVGPGGFVAARHRGADRKKLEAAGVILGYTALVDAKKLGQGITAFISVQIDDPASYPQFSGALLKVPEVTECHHVVGEFDYLVKVKTRDTTTSSQLISDRIRPIDGVGRTRTVIVLSTLKEGTAVPMDRPQPKERKKRHG